MFAYDHFVLEFIAGAMIILVLSNAVSKTIGSLFLKTPNSSAQRKQTLGFLHTQKLRRAGIKNRFGS